MRQFVKEMERLSKQEQKDALSIMNALLRDYFRQAPQPEVRAQAENP